jgi:histidinol-phosphate aminotransferase
MSNPFIEKLVRPEIRALSAYHVPPATGMIKLDAMENPYVWDEAMKAAWLERLQQIDVNRYPDPQGAAVKAGLREAMGIAPKHDLLLGNGSDEILQIIIMALARPGAVVLAAEPAFVMYKMISLFAGLKYVGVPLRADFSLDEGAMLAAIAKEQPAVIFLAEPNNPTGNKYDRAAVEAIIAATPGLVVLDEAYLPFTDGDALGLLRHDNVVVMRTVSKLGLAGLRLGLLIGAPAWLHEFDKLRLPYNISVLTQASAAFALEHYGYFREQARRIRHDRRTLFAELQKLPGWQVFPSEANFILVRLPVGRARPVFEALKTKNILIKCLDGAHPLLQDCLRLTVGTPDENAALVAALQAVTAVA